MDVYGEIKLESNRIDNIGSQSHLSRSLRRLVRKKIAVICLVLICIVYGLGIFAPIVSPYDYSAQDYTSIRQSPSFEMSEGIKGFFTKSHFAGTDRAGRDIFTRVLWGIQNTLILTFIGMITGGLVIGVTFGLISGYFGGKIDSLIMRVGEIFTVIPSFLLVLIITATLKPRIREWVIWVEDNSFLDGLISSGFIDYLVVSVALVSFGWYGTARLVRSQILFLKEAQYIEAARAIGVSNWGILFKHLLPNALSPIIVTVTMGMGSMVGVEIFLSWVGVGIQPPRPSLGLMLWEGGNISVLRNQPWMLLAPGIVTWVLMLSWNLLGDAMNDVFNPRTR